jgi:glycosyltransferase involved in cell wall biosynthesis
MKAFNARYTADQYPTISIVTPCYNSGEYLEQTILSVLEQNYPKLEYIIIDGGSTDNSIEIIKKYQNKLAYWISEKDEGMYYALQKGFEKSTGEIMAWINADDLYHKKSFLAVAELFSKYSNINWLVGASTHWDEYGRGVNVDRSRKFTRYDFLMGDYEWIQQESCFFRRALWEKAGSYINTELHYAGDFELWLRFFRFEKLYVTNALIGGHRIRSSNQLSLEGAAKYFEEAGMMLKKEVITQKDKNKMKRYKIITWFLNIGIRIMKKVMNEYRKIEFGAAENIDFDRKSQEFEMK